jgi:hypothetical protein
VKLVGFIGEGESEVHLLRSNAFKEFLRDMNLSSVGEFDACGRENLLNRTSRIEDFFKIFGDLQAEKVFILSDLENDPCISNYKSRLYNYSSLKIALVAVKAIEAWLLSDSDTLSFLLKERFTFADPENTDTLPIIKLREIFIDRTGRGLGIRKPKIIDRFIRGGFTIEKAAEHPNCNSAKYFIRKLKEFTEE